MYSFFIHYCINNWTFELCTELQTSLLLSLLSMKKLRWDSPCKAFRVDTTHPPPPRTRRTPLRRWTGRPSIGTVSSAWTPSLPRSREPPWLPGTAAAGKGEPDRRSRHQVSPGKARTRATGPGCSCSASEVASPEQQPAASAVEPTTIRQRESWAFLSGTWRRMRTCNTNEWTKYISHDF